VEIANASIGCCVGEDQVAQREFDKSALREVRWHPSRADKHGHTIMRFRGGGCRHNGVLRKRGLLNGSVTIPEAE
jgi:hypothetical protein